MREKAGGLALRGNRPAPQSRNLLSPRRCCPRASRVVGGGDHALRDEQMQGMLLLLNHAQKDDEKYKHAVQHDAYGHDGEHGPRGLAGRLAAARRVVPQRGGGERSVGGGKHARSRRHIGGDI